MDESMQIPKIPERLARLVADNADLFSDRYRGIQFEAGWTDLFAEVLAEWRARGPLPLITQTKEKLGTFRIYREDLTHPVAREIALRAEQRSATICDRCGAPGRLINSKRLLGVRCPECEEK